MLPPRGLLAWVIVLYGIRLIVSLIVNVSLDWFVGRIGRVLV
jgi:hypothetical protein